MHEEGLIHVKKEEKKSEENLLILIKDILLINLWIYELFQSSSREEIVGLCFLNLLNNNMR